MVLDPPPDARLETPEGRERLALWLLERAHALLEGVLGQVRAPVVALPPDGIALRHLEREALLLALERSDWVQVRAAKLLKISPRVMHYKIRRHRLHPPPHRAWRTSTRRPLAAAKSAGTEITKSGTFGTSRLKRRRGETARNP